MCVCVQHRPCSAEGADGHCQCTHHCVAGRVRGVQHDGAHGHRRGLRVGDAGTLNGPQLLEQHVESAEGEGKEVEELVQRLAQKGRAFGFRIILATQRPSVKVINGDIKVNFDVQICLKVKKEVDSVVILDEVGGNTLMGKGDALLKSSGYLNTERIQGFFKKD